MLSTRRRDFLRALGALGLCSLPFRALSDGPADKVASAADFCGAGPAGRPLYIPGKNGLLSRLAVDAPLRMRASPLVARDGAPWPLGFVVEHGGSRYVNPTLVLRRGERVHIDFENALTEPTIVHWHGLAVDTRNDGAGMTLAPPGQRYSYDFEVRNRSGLYWYHPHPHGLTAGQAYRGLFGLVEVEDEDQRRLRMALDLAPGKSEIPLVLQDRRSGDYEPTEADRMHGFLGEDVLINGTACPYLDVATRIYRFRVLNASNARTYLLGLRTAGGEEMPFTLIGADGGLLASPQRCSEAFIATAERIDILVDLSDATVGDTLVLETRAFDPMHMEMGSTAAAVDHLASHEAPSSASMPPSDHAA